MPSLLPAIAALLLVERTTAFERYLNAAAILLMVFYLAYWHDGFFLGPRLMYPLMPVLALWTARAFVIARQRLGDGMGWRGIAWSGVVAGCLAATTAIPARTMEYRDGLRTMRWDPDRAAREAGVHGALVLVRESWGAQLVARMWALGVGRSDAEALYAAVDQCVLETSLTRAETGGEAAASFKEQLQPALADRARLQRSPFSADPTARYLPGSDYSEICLARQQDDQQGFTLFPPLLLATGRQRLCPGSAREGHAVAEGVSRPPGFPAAPRVVGPGCGAPILPRVAGFALRGLGGGDPALLERQRAPVAPEIPEVGTPPFERATAVGPGPDQSGRLGQVGSTGSTARDGGWRGCSCSSER